MDYKFNINDEVKVNSNHFAEGSKGIIVRRKFGFSLIHVFSPLPSKLYDVRLTDYYPATIDDDNAVLIRARESDLEKLHS